MLKYGFSKSKKILKFNSTSRKIPEMLARHCDLLLKNTKAKYNDQEMEQMLSDAVRELKFFF